MHYQLATELGSPSVLFKEKVGNHLICKMICSPVFRVTHFFFLLFKYSPVDTFIDFRKRERERGKKTHINRLLPVQSQLVMEPATFLAYRTMLQLSHLARARVTFSFSRFSRTCQMTDNYKYYFPIYLRKTRK